MQPFQYLAFDPGGATGWAYARCYESGVFKIESGTIWETEHHQDIAGHIEDRLGGVGNWLQTEPLTVITESFEFRQSPDSAKKRRGLELVSREYIGVMKLVCSQNWVPLIQQMPSHALSRISDEKLEAFGYLKTPLHDCRHENDALRHLFFRLAFKDKISYWTDKLK